MWIRQLILGVIGLSAGAVVAGGLFAFISGLGIVSDLADRTHTGHKIHLYEDVIALGGILGNISSVYQIGIPMHGFMLGFLGLFAGIFVGCWAMALAEILNLFPIFVRRLRILNYIPFVILCMAIGKGVGLLIYFINGW